MSMDLLGLDDLDDEPIPTARKIQKPTTNSAFHDLLGLENDEGGQIGGDLVKKNATKAVPPYTSGIPSQMKDTAPGNDHDDGDTDDWGDFEDASPAPITTDANMDSDIYLNSMDSKVSESPHQGKQARQEQGQATAPSQEKAQRPPPRSKPRDPNVLFDVEDEVWNDPDAEFGDFEDVAPTSAVLEHREARIETATLPRKEETRTKSTIAQSRTAPPLMATDSIDLLGHLGEESPAPPKNMSKASGGPSFGATKAKPAVKFPKPETKPPQRDEAWEDFEQLAVSPPPVMRSSLSPFPKIMVRDSKPTISAPPTNIPPPSVLLSLFVSLLGLVVKHLITPLNTLPQEVRTRTLSEDITLDFIKAYISLIHVLARILAGRQVRWNRDALLSQGMKIGAATAGGRSGGLKLAGVDRGEKEREDSAVVDVLDAWKGIVGRLRGLVSKTKSSSANGQGLAAVPNIKENMTVKSLKQEEGGIPSSGQCALCGLKRNERVMGVDNDVVDAFGEWWVEDVKMHADCRTFWESHRDQLKQR
ncbi:hypothetical protein P152DRAFT_108984 [Eremomyces bilateralis CBS 781.70]|uniref:Uncharacterized protein n=1 Tax=Eremomyces bilateralis CBS 781.70 TaxID=1392243 RepID=A0A6G1GDW4_9PEZI|nr:uncharacterized protein P152DRAFT_108984 [Eremomyces bilateralis CBS 781.70]KAF1816049.1 hypothetical protein P152DRAFT_108984 [Eremomyces bilateralis CBS 781.70]